MFDTFNILNAIKPPIKVVGTSLIDGEGRIVATASSPLIAHSLAYLIKRGVSLVRRDSEVDNKAASEKNSE